MEARDQAQATTPLRSEDEDREFPFLEWILLLVSIVAVFITTWLMAEKFQLYLSANPFARYPGNSLIEPQGLLLTKIWGASLLSLTLFGGLLLRVYIERIVFVYWVGSILAVVFVYWVGIINILAVGLVVGAPTLNGVCDPDVMGQNGMAWVWVLMLLLVTLTAIVDCWKAEKTVPVLKTYAALILYGLIAPAVLLFSGAEFLGRNLGGGQMC